ncbi:hypothetical protein GCM10023213_19820 [Prosthecobacter algae]|uniref:DNA primase/helicase n=1 Tax=Prosthecobacter algae TaxID=1144682 RepID=A0ABP9P501_9BACT
MSDELPTDDTLEEMAERLRPMHELADVTLPDEAAKAAPTLYVGTEKSRPPAYRLADELGKLIGGKQMLFLRNDIIVTIDPVTGSCREMTPHEFVTWVVQRAGVILIKGRTTDDDGKSKIIEGDLGVDLARVILASPNFRLKLPIVEAINRVRMPAFRDELDERDNLKRKGFKKLVLLAEGYDAHTRTYTLMGGHFQADLDPDVATAWLAHLLRDFQWGDETRSRSVFVQFFITLFCRSLYIGRAPFGVFVSNLPGSGKSKLAQLCIEPVEGAVGAPSGWNIEDKQETRKEMDAAAQDFASYLWFDDVDRIKVRSTDLNRFVTSKTWACRVMGTSQRFKGSLRALVLMTGNGLTVDDNLERRTLWVDLFARMKASERPIAADRIELNEQFFEDESNMKHCLAVMWSMVRHWDESGRPRTKQRSIEGFDSWCEVVASIADCCGFWKGLAPYEAPDGGNQEGREWKVLATALIDEYCIAKKADKAEVTMRDVIRTARLHGLFQDVLGSLDQVMTDLDERVGLKKWKWKEVADPEYDEEEVGSFPTREPTEADKRRQAAEWTDKSMDSTWAKRFRKSAVAGQFFQGKDGRMYEFGDRGASRKSKFVLAAVGV